MLVPIPSGESHVDVETITRTQGFLAPEYVVHGRTSKKSDVYSFGILLFELFAGNRIGNLLLQSNERISNLGSPCSSNKSVDILANLFKSYFEDNILEDENKKQVERC
jgi:serine/threonine protein kinase